jgi:anaerobic selenocysteine-containing dehydrogenase
VILPPPPPSRSAHYDFSFYFYAVRNVANYSPALLPLDDGMRTESEILQRLLAIVAGFGWDADIALGAQLELARMAAKEGIDVDDLHGDSTAEKIIDLRLRSGPYDVTLADLKARPHGIDFGPLGSRIPDILRTPSGRIELAPPAIVAAVRALADTPPDDPDEFVIVGRRHLRSNNSWMHNVPVLVKGRPLCTVVVNRGDADRLGLVDGGSARVTSRVGRAELTVEVTDDIAPGVISIPHGWGHDGAGIEMSVAAATSGTNVNTLTDDLRLDPLSGNAVLNGIPVRVEKA